MKKRVILHNGEVNYYCILREQSKKMENILKGF